MRIYTYSLTDNCYTHLHIIPRITTHTVQKYPNIHYASPIHKFANAACQYVATLFSIFDTLFAGVFGSLVLELRNMMLSFPPKCMNVFDAVILFISN